MQGTPVDYKRITVLKSAGQSSDLHGPHFPNILLVSHVSSTFSCSLHHPSPLTRCCTMPPVDLHYYQLIRVNQTSQKAKWSCVHVYIINIELRISCDEHWYLLDAVFFFIFRDLLRNQHKPKVELYRGWNRLCVILVRLNHWLTDRNLSLWTEISAEYGATGL